MALRIDSKPAAMSMGFVLEIIRGCVGGSGRGNKKNRQTEPQFRDCLLYAAAVRTQAVASDKRDWSYVETREIRDPADLQT